MIRDVLGASLCKYMLIGGMEVQELEYLNPKTLDEALELLDKYKRDIKILAGGTDLIVALRDNIIDCKYLMNIKDIKELQEVKETSSELSIGAAVCLNDIIGCEEVKNSYPILVQAGKTLANSLLRNRATLIGNICNASPGGDMISPCIVLDAHVEIVSKREVRNLVLKEFFKGVKKTDLKEDEIVTKIIFPKIKGCGRYLRKSRIKGHDLAQVGVAVFIKNQGGLKISIGAAGPTPIIIEDFTSCNRSFITDKEEIINKVMSEIKPIGDQRATKEFRIAMIEYLTRNILNDIEGEC